MSTYMAKPQDIKRKWYVIDAAGKTLGVVAVKAADILRGKLKPEYTPHVDCGDSVIIINAEKVVLTGRKLEQKVYQHHTGYIGGLKTVKCGALMKTQPELVIEAAVKGMVPDNTIGRSALTRLRVYRGAAHKQEAQQPEAVAL